MNSKEYRYNKDRYRKKLDGLNIQLHDKSKELSEVLSDIDKENILLSEITKNRKDLEVKFSKEEGIYKGTLAKLKKFIRVLTDKKTDIEKYVEKLDKEEKFYKKSISKLITRKTLLEKEVENLEFYESKVKELKNKAEIAEKRATEADKKEKDSIYRNEQLTKQGEILEKEMDKEKKYIASQLGGLQKFEKNLEIFRQRLIREYEKKGQPIPKELQNKY